MRATFRREGPPPPFSALQYAATLFAAIAACELLLLFVLEPWSIPHLAAALAILALLLSARSSPALSLLQSAVTAAAHALAFAHATHNLHTATHFPAALLFPLLLLLWPPPSAACFRKRHPRDCGCAALHAAAVSFARALPGCAASAAAAGRRECVAAALAGGVAVVTLAVASGVVDAEAVGLDGAVERGAFTALPVSAALLADEPATWVLAGAAQVAVVCAISHGSLRPR